jgi:hypothetical protein
VPGKRKHKVDSSDKRKIQELSSPAGQDIGAYGVKPPGFCPEPFDERLDFFDITGIDGKVGLIDERRLVENFGPSPQAARVEALFGLRQGRGKRAGIRDSLILKIYPHGKRR